MKPSFPYTLLLTLLPSLVSAAGTGLEARLPDFGPGAPSKEVMIFFDAAPDGMEPGVNETVRAVVSMEITGGVAPVQADTAYMIDAAGKRLGQNMATTAALEKDKLTKFIYEARGLSSEEMAKVAGIALSFKNSGESYQKVTIHIADAQGFRTRDIGSSCIAIGEKILIAAEQKVRTVDDVRNQDRPKGSIAGDGGGSGGGGTDTGFKSPTAAATGFLSGDVGWSNASFALASDNMYATLSLAPNQSTQGIFASAFGFTVPLNATIDGIEITIEKGGGGNITDGTVELSKDGGTAIGSNLAQGAWPGSETVVTYGGSGSLWGSSWTAAELDTGSFGVVLSAQNGPGGGAAPIIDAFKAKIYYIAGSGSVYDAFTDLIRSFSRRAYCLVTLSC